MESKEELKAQEILDYMGFSDVKTLDELNANFKTKYYTKKEFLDNKELRDTVTGITFTKVKQNMVAKAREAEIPFTKSELDDLTVEQIFDLFKERQAEMYKTQLAEVQGQVGKSGEEAVKPYIEKISKYEQSLADEKKAKAEIASQFDQFRQEADGKIRSTRVQYFRKDLTSDIESQFDPNLKKDELKMKGWNSHINENFKFDYDENDNPIIMDKTGSKIKNPKKADEWLTPKEVLQAEADKLGLIPKNQQAGKPYTGQPAPNQPVVPQTPKVGGTRLAPGMEKYLTK